MNLLSLLLGIAAVVFAVHSVQVRGCLACCTLSGVCSSAVLLGLCTVLNAVALIRSRSQQTCNHC